jgi:DeoR/GlpR family transcriptional regulator of sugar metabolism
MSIRKDLEKLENQGFLHRSHGGAVLAQDYISVFDSISDPNESDKIEIGITAERIIEEDDVIFLGHGFTCLQIAKCIKEQKKHVIIITNSINIVYELSSCSFINIITTGGEVISNNDRFYYSGSLSLHLIDCLLINKIFITVDAIHYKYGYTLSSPDILNFYNKLCTKTDNIYIVADYTKFDKLSMLSFRSIDSIKKVITNEKIPKRYKELYYDNEIQLFTTISTIEE